VPEELISTRRIFDGVVVNLRVDTIRKESGEVTTREIIEHNPCIAVIPLDADDNIIFVRQFRRAATRDLLEIPAGGIEPGETPEEATVREMQEEVGLKPNTLVRLGGAYSTPGFSDEYLHLFLATDLEPGHLVAEDTDEIEVVRVPLEDVPALVTAGRIEDAKTLAALYLLESRRKQVK
jgi:ADP-ribose pyrophosphatase